VQLVLQSHFYLTSQANFDDGANAIIDADINLYGGRHLLAIGQAFVDRGILSELPIELEISHSPLGDIENVNGPYPLLASMTHTFPIDSALVYYRFGTDTIFTMLMMAPTANPDEYLGQIPGPGYPSEINYFVRVVDSLGISANLPADAPLTTFSFLAGPDTVFPVITHQPLNDFPDVSWPPVIYATVTDNIGVDSVWVEFRIADGPWISAPLAPVDTTDVWWGALSGSVVAGDSVEYRIGAMDSSSNSNLTFLPASGFYSFEILEMQVVTRYADGFAIPDLGGRLDTLIITDRMQIYELHAYVDIDHPFIGDLYIFLQSPRNRRILLHNRTGGDGDSIVGWYPDDILPDTGSFESVVGDSSQGRWLFYVADFRTGGSGVVNTWGLRIIGTGIVDDVNESGATLPEAFYLRQNYPNPFNPTTRISFGLSENSRVRLEVFDILGRRVATLMDREMSSGFHSAEWDGVASDGRPVTSGIYFARLTSGRESKVIRMSLLK
jgi:subtilisin-like proprotein convertase family protein